MPEQLAIWIPNDLNSASKTKLIADHMITNGNVIQIDVDTDYHNNFTEYYDRHIKQGETTTTFCYKDGIGINVGYLIDNANKKTYATLLSLDVDPADPTQFEVLAMLVFKWSPTANAVKIQAFCGNQKRPSKGAGTKLLNFLKKTLTEMDINEIYLNPIPSAIGYYSNHQFKKEPKGKVHDSSSPKPKSSSKSKTKSKTKSSSKSKYKGIPTMRVNLRAAKNWKKAKTKLRSYQALTRKTHGKSHIPTSKKILWAKIDKIVANLSSDHREMVEYRDIIDLLDREEGVKINDEEEELVRRYLSDKYQIY